jgi:hypothetical protein
MTHWLEAADRRPPRLDLKAEWVDNLEWMTSESVSY